MPLTADADLSDVTQGDDVSYDLAFTDDSGNAIDITGWTVWLTVKDSLGQSDVDAPIQKEITSHDDPNNGETSFSFSASETKPLSGTKYYDLQVQQGTGSIRTVVTGTVYFAPEVTDSP